MPSEWLEGAQVLAREYGLSETEALDRVSSQTARMEFRETVAANLGDTFAGLRYDPVSGVQTVLTTEPESAAAEITSLAQDAGIEVAVEEATYSYDELRSLAEKAKQGGLGIAATDVVSAQIDDNSNSVVAYVPEDRLQALSTQRVHEAVTLEAYVDDQGVEEVCTGKRSCGAPLRGGIGLWRTTSTNYVCSLGYTATSGDGARWAITAGHCRTVANQNFGHGDQYIGPVRDVVNNPTSGPHGDVDVARIRMDSSYWRAWPAAGYLLRINSSNVVQNDPNRIVHTIDYRSSIEIADVYCLSALSPGWGDSCGSVTDEFDQDGLVVIGNYDACPGDSGGAWVWNNGSGDYWGIGVHEGGRNGCPQKDTGGSNDSQGWSRFSAIPDINDYWDATSSVTIRINE
ncbi:trypsin-like serine protease [Georgenia muralis]